MKRYIFIVLFLACALVRVHAVGWTPTDGGLVVNLEQGDRFLLSVWLDLDNDGVEDPGEEFFVINYNRYTGGHFKYEAGLYLKLAPQATGATVPSDMSIWSIGAPLNRVIGGKNYDLGAKDGTVYTIWNDGKTLKTADDFKFLGDLTSIYDDAKAVDVVFVIPTVRGVPTVDGRAGLSSFDPNNTLKRGTAPFDGATGTGFLGMTYREVYMFDIPRKNSPISYTNASLVTFNTTLSTQSWSAGNITKGHAAYAYADSKHDKTTRTIFRLYLLDKPFVSCPTTYFFATDEQDYKRFRKGPGTNPKLDWTDSTAIKKIYTMDYLTPLTREGSTTIHKSGYMTVPVPDSTYYYVGYEDKYYSNIGATPPKMGTPGAFSQFTKIRELPLSTLPTLKAPAGAYGRMVLDSTSTVDNHDVAFEPAGYFLKVNTGKNVRMRQDPENPNIWISEEMWTITSAWAALYIKATLMTGAEFSEYDPGADVAGWSVYVQGTSVPVSDGTSVVDKSGYARITVNDTRDNGHIEFILADQTKVIHYNNNGFLGVQIPDQYPLDGQTTLNVEAHRLKPDYTFLGWNTAADGSGTMYQPDDTYTFAGDGEVTLYAQATYTGTYNVAISFTKDDGKRYFLTHPGTAAPRYSRARHYDDWTNVWQGMASAENTDPLYLNSFETRHPSNEVKAYQPEIPVGERHLYEGEIVLDPRRYTMKGAVDSLTFYEYFSPAKDEYLGLYYGAGLNTIVANNTWAGLFRSTSAATSTGWPDYKLPYIHTTKLYSQRYVIEEDPTNHPDSLTLKIRANNAEGTYVAYKPATNQFDGVVDPEDATEFQISAIVVADEHYVVLPDTSTTWRDTITFGYHENAQATEQVRSALIGKQLMACMMVDGDTIYFHPNRDKIITDPNNLYLSSAFRVSQNFELIPDARVTSVAEEDRVTHATTSDYWLHNITSGNSSPMNVTDAGGNYIDIIDTFRITLSHGAISKIKKYYGRWKNGAAGLKVSTDGLSRTRDVIVKTKTYHYGAATTQLVLTPEHESYTFNPLEGNSQQINFTLTKETTRQLLDANNQFVRNELVSIDTINTSLALGPSDCRFTSGGTYFRIPEGGAVEQRITLLTKEQNATEDNFDTLIVTKEITIDAVTYPVSVRVPLLQTSLEGEELIWSVASGSQRYYIMAGTDGLIFRKYTTRNSILYKEGTTIALVMGSKNAANDDAKYITPWHFRYNPADANQLSFKTEYGVDRYLKVTDGTPGLHETDSSFFTYHYVHVYTNANANEEEQVKIKYGADKWLKFSLEGGSGAHLELVDNEANASVFSWSYPMQEHSLLNNGTYPSRDTVVFGYNTNMSVGVQTRYKAYKEYSMLVNNTTTYLCREEEADIADLIDGEQEWLTTRTITRIPDARTFEGGSTPSPAVSGLSTSLNATTLTTTVSTSGATTSPTNVKIGGQYVNIVDTLHVQIGLQSGAPKYRFKGDWSSFKSVNDAELKIPLIRKTYHTADYDSLVCTVEGDAYNYTFPNTITTPVAYTFVLGTQRHTGTHVLDVDDNAVAVIDAHIADSTNAMHLNNPDLAEVRLADAQGNTPSWCRISNKGAHSVQVTCTESGIRSPRTAYIYIAYIVTVNGEVKFVNYKLTVSQPSLYQYANNQHLVHSSGASGDPIGADGMQQVHENKRVLYYYPEQDVELPIRENHFFGWWRWFREGAGEIGDSDIPDSLWRTNPINAAGKYNYPFRIIGDSVDDPERPGKKKLVTMGRYTVFHYRSKDYPNVRTDPPVKMASVAPPTVWAGIAAKPTVTYAVDISNYYDKLPMSLSQKNQVDTAYLDTMIAVPEPTLSLREVFELHPWTEMADTLDRYKTRIPDGEGVHTDKVFPLAGEKYMEDHVMMAPLKNQLLLKTEQRYNYENLTKKGHSESLLGYYMRDDNWSLMSTERDEDGWSRQDSMIWCGGWDAECLWYTYDSKTQKYTRCTHTITESDDFLKVPAKENIPAGQDFDTVYYCLRARSWKSQLLPPDSEEPVPGDYMFNICRYMLIYHDPTDPTNPKNYGPYKEAYIGGEDKALITNDEIEQRYEVLEVLNFDYNQPGRNYAVYPHPLPWADASYGYTYLETPDLPHNRLHDESDFPNMGEYGLVNRIPYTSYWHPMEQHGSAENGYMIYCDGMSSSGQVAALSLETHLCSGQKMFFSGYVGNPSNQKGKANPNFIFSVQGSTNGTKWEDITSYTTGDIKPSDQWYQIFFPIIFNESKEYKHFRVRIYNMSSDWDGNDFIIDDMRIIATKPPLIAYQATTACKENTEDDTPTHVILRVDYQGITGEGYNDTIVYYTVHGKNSENVERFVPMEDGYLEQETHEAVAPKPDTICGKLYIPKKIYEPKDEDSIFVNMNELIDTFKVSQAKHALNPSIPIYREGFIYEILEGDIRPVKYIIHDAKMNPKDTFTVHMSGNYKELMSSLCGMTSRLKVSNQMVLELNGLEHPDVNVAGLCANATYDIGLRVKGSLYLDSVAPIDLNGTCYNDWLLYGDTLDSKGTPLARYGYKYRDIEKVVKDILRCEPYGTTNGNQFAPNLASVSRNEMQRIQEAQSVKLSDDDLNPYDILADLVHKGFLTLYQPKMTATVYSGDSVQYTIFPILGTGTDAMHHSNVEVCPLPIVVKLKPSADSGKVPLIVGGLHRAPSEMSQPVVVLANAAAANEEFKVRVDSIMENVGIYSVNLRSTDDPDFREGIHSLSLTPDQDYPKTPYYVKADSIAFHPSSTSNYEMQQGYTYTFDIVMQTILGKDTFPGGCKVGTIPFSLAIVPDYLRWDPQSETSTEWNQPGNWIGIDDRNNPLHENARFAPLRTTAVLIPAVEAGMQYPELPVPAELRWEDSIQQAGFQYNKCDYIRFLPGAAMSQQQRMEYTQAIIDMPMPHNTWAFRTAPVKGMISGDLFMANADIANETPLWEVGAFDAAGRTSTYGNASYWLSLFSTTTTRVGNSIEGIADETQTADAGWSKVTNAVTLPLPPAQGFAVYARTKSGEPAAARLPKSDDLYYYFNANGDKMEDIYEQNLAALRETEAVAAGGHAGDMTFHSTSEDYTLTKEVSSQEFVFGNPTMGFIDIWGFIADNGLTEEIGYMTPAGAYTTISKSAAEDDTEDVITEQSRYLPPMYAMVVKKSPAATSLTVTLNANRILVSPGKKVRAGAPRHSAPRRYPKGIMTVTATNPVSPRCYSRLLVGQGYHDAVYEGEDALLTTINIDRYTNNTMPATPFNLYAAEGQYGLCIDLRDSIVNVPLSFYMSNLPFDPVTRLWFTGVNNISGALVLYDTISGTEQPIADGIYIDIQTPEQSHEVRYYIRRRGYHTLTGTDIATGFESYIPEDDDKAVKIIKNDHVYILRRGQIYTILGQKVQ